MSRSSTSSSESRRELARFAARLFAWAGFFTTATAVVFLVILPGAFRWSTAGEMAVDRAIYLWGDSATFRGIDDELLARLTGRPVLSAAARGAHVYTLSVLADRVPEGSPVVVGASLPMLVGQLGWRANFRRGLSFSGLARFWRSGAAPWDIPLLVLRSQGWRVRMFTPHRLFPSAPRVEERTLAETVAAVAETPPEVAAARLGMLRDTLGGLVARRCPVLVVDFPMTATVEEHLARSPHRAFHDELRGLETEGVEVLSGARLEGEGNPFFDHLHLNRNGAREMTRLIAVRLAGLRSR